ncbi:MAG: transposon-encoded TnpW family protein [Oscillospiraceae bacterium]|jgi:hypothetical protein|nr:transposon-encoded TnpW family protein [Oscillospiraceae bacterium]
MNSKTQSTLLPPTDGEITTKIKFGTKTEYKIGKTTYRVTSHFDESGEEFKTKIARLLKQDLEFELCAGLTQLDE